jgi:DNA-binding NtrC family response regulator
LVVDDEPDILAALRTFLEGSLDVEVVSAASGDEGLAALRAGGVDLVISDYRMPVMDGLVFLSRAEELCPKVPRVLITAYPDMQLAINALNQAHIARFLVKPVEPDQLQGVIEGLLGKRLRSTQSEAAFERAAGKADPRPAKP